MVVLQVIQTLPDVLAVVPDGTVWHQLWHSVPEISPADWSILAQQFETDSLADARNWFANFIESGQLWALIIGIIIGYVLRGLTSYG